MKKSFRLLLTGTRSAYENMAVDEALVASARSGHGTPIFRLYSWINPSVSTGYFQDILKEINIEYCDKSGISLVRRITGGRGVYHSRGITYSLISPVESSLFRKNLKESLKRISEGIVAGLRNMGVNDAELFIPEDRTEKRNNIARSPFCFGSTSPYEIIAGGKKLVGSAQRRWPDILLQQGHIPFDNDLDCLCAIFKRFDLDNAKKRTTSLSSYISLDALTQQAERDLAAGFEQALGIRLEESSLSSEELELTGRLVKEKYGARDWTTTRKRAKLPLTND